MAPPKKEPARGRAKLVDAVKTPLGFFVVATLVVEVSLGLIVGLGDPSARRIALIGAFMLFVLLVAIVAFFAYYRPEALAGTRPAQSPSTASTELTSTDVIPRKTFRLGYFRSVEAERGWGATHDADLIKKLRATFGKNATYVGTGVGSKELTHALMAQRFDVLHLDAPVRGDHVVFGGSDMLSSTALASLLKLSDTKVVVLPACQSFQLAARLPREIAVVAASGNVTVASARLWAPCFYELLARGVPIREAHDTARNVSSSDLGIFAAVNYKVKA